MGKNKKLFVSALIVFFAICVCAAATPLFSSIAHRVNNSHNEKEFIDSLNHLSCEQIVDEMNAILDVEHDADSVMLYAASLLERVDALSADYLLDVASDVSNHKVVRSTFLQLYSDKVDNSFLSDRIVKLILDENEEFDVRINAVYAISKSEQAEQFLNECFFVVDEDVSYHILKYLYLIESTFAESIADTVLSSYEKYSPQKISIALIAKTQALLDNTSGRNYDELLEEKELFSDIAIKIHETYPNELIPVDGESEIGSTAANPAILAVESLYKVRCEKAVRYMLMEFAEKTRFDKNFIESVQYSVVRTNADALIKLAESGSLSDEDILMIIEAIKHCPYKELIEPLKNKISLSTYSDGVLDKSEAIDYLSKFDEKFEYFTVPTNKNEYIDSWRW